MDMSVEACCDRLILRVQRIKLLLNIDVPDIIMNNEILMLKEYAEDVAKLQRSNPTERK